MAGAGSYDTSANIFDPVGRVYQVEYAMKAVENSGTAMAITCKDGIVFAVEKFKLSKMMVPGTIKRIMPVSRHAGLATAGILPDARQIVDRARDEVRVYKDGMGEDMPANILAERLGHYVHVFTLYSGARPFGAAALYGSVDPETKKPSLFCIEPQGMVYKYKGTAVGKGKQAAKTEIEKLYNTFGEDLTCEKALIYAAKILHKVHDEKEGDFELEMAWICPGSNYQHAPVPADKLKPAEVEAKRMLEAEEEDE